jgi:hypothetical protein
MINLTIPYSPQKIARTLSFVVVFLTSVHIVTQASKYFWNHERLLGFVKLFDLNLESNIPSWYSSCALLFCAYLLAHIAYLKKGFSYSGHWKVLSFIFVYLSADEAAALHEKWNFLLHPLIHTTGPLAFPWVIPFSIFVIIVLLSYLKFLGHLVTRIRWLFLAAGSIYVGAALGSELIEGYLLGDSGIETFAFQLAVALEEFLEMFGIVIFIYALLSYLQGLSKNSPPSLDQQETNYQAVAIEFSSNEKKVVKE